MRAPLSLHRGFAAYMRWVQAFDQKMFQNGPICAEYRLRRHFDGETGR